MSDRAEEPDETRPEEQEGEAPDPSIDSGSESGPADDGADPSTDSGTEPGPADDVRDPSADDETEASVVADEVPDDAPDASPDSAGGNAVAAAGDRSVDTQEAAAGTAAADSAGVAAAAVEPPSPDVALADEASPLPGVHRGGFQRLPTAPVAVTTETAPPEPGSVGAQEPIAQWLMPEPAAQRRGLAGWALAFSIAGLVVSLFVGWGFPIGLVGVVSAILALRRPLESRTVAVWALVLGSVSVLYSAGWLLYAAGRANLIG